MIFIILLHNCVCQFIETNVRVSSKNLNLNLFIAIFVLEDISPGIEKMLSNLAHKSSNLPLIAAS